MDAKNKRVLWLINHKTLMDFEPALLESLGFEVYIPKLFPQNPGFRSASVTYDYDKNLTIPGEKINILNNFNFYTTKLTPNIRKILNSYFSIAIVSAHHILFREIIQNFKGHIVLRAFGLIEEECKLEGRKCGYGRNLEILLGSSAPDAIRDLGNRFHFGIAYKGIELIEPNYLKNRAIFLPLGLPDKFFLEENGWLGTEAKVLFICPVIEESIFYKRLYIKFKKDFKNIPYLIGGYQSKKIADPCVIGGIERSKYDQILKNLKVMYYHSEEPRHLHYHPLEAIAIGMPLIFMKNGILGHIDFDNNQPGACRNVKEARKKIRQILAGDMKLVKEIKENQKYLLNPFRRDYCLSEWKKNFLPKMVKLDNSITAPPRIAIIVDSKEIQSNYKLHKLAISLANIIDRDNKIKENSMNPIFTMINETSDHKKEVKDLISQGVIFRDANWSVSNWSDIERIMRIDGSLMPSIYPNYLLLKDGIKDFFDCELLLLFIHPLLFPLAPFLRYAVIIDEGNSICFYKNDELGTFELYTNFLRESDFILTTSVEIKNKIISLYGISPNRIFSTHLNFNNYSITNVKDDAKTFWKIITELL